MAVISGVTVDFSVSPRIITVPDTLSTISIQDLHDTLRTIEDEPTNMGYDHLTDSVGKADLGGGIQTSITMTLQNAKLAFADRAGPGFVQCTVTGGNLVAVDANQASIDPIQTTDFTQIVTSRSTEAALIAAEAEWTQTEKDDHVAASAPKAAFRM